MGKFAQILYKPLDYLSTFHNDRYKHQNRAIVAGYGGGKTYAVCIENLIVSGLNRGIPNMIVEPSYPMVRDILIPTLEEILDENNIKYFHHKQSHNFYFPWWDGHIWLRSGDEPKKLKGPNMGLVTIDEPFIQHEDVYKIGLSRSRHPKANVYGMILSGTPEQLNWGYDLITDQKKNFKLYSGSTRDNFYLPETYLQNLLTSYSDKEVQAYVDGQFIDMNVGQCYYAFSELNIIPNYKPVNFAPLEVSCDFNIGIMSWHIGQEISGVDYTFDYVEQTGSAKTEEMCILLKEKLNLFGTQQVIFYADIAGSANRPEASYTNIEIIQRHFPGSQVHTRHIQNIGDRISATNARLKDSTGQVKAYVTANCTRLIKDYRRVNWDHFFKKGTAGDLTHASDGESYKFFAKYPPFGKVSHSRQNLF